MTSASLKRNELKSSNYWGNALLYLGIDQSKRSTGCVWVDDKGELVNFLLINPAKEVDGVELIKEQLTVIDHALRHKIHADKALIEGIAHGAVGASKDLLCGLQWCIRVMLDLEYGLYCGTVPVSMWRSKVLSKEDAKEAKASGKDGLKWATFNAMPAMVRKQFAEYVEEQRIVILAAKGLERTSKSRVYVDSMLDLSDAYWISQHCRKLSISK